MKKQAPASGLFFLLLPWREWCGIIGWGTVTEYV